MRSVHFVKKTEWPHFQPPDKSFTVSMPEAPLYYQRPVTTEGQIGPISTQDVFASAVTGAVPAKFVVIVSKSSSFSNLSEQENKIEKLERELRKLGKVRYLNRTKDSTGSWKLDTQVLVATTIVDIRLMFIESNSYFLEVDQESSSYNEALRDRFFGSFKYVGASNKLMTALTNLARGKTKENKRKSDAEYLAGALSGNPEDQNELGKLYLNKEQPTEQDYAEAMKYFKTAADQGYARAVNNVGVMYEKGWGVAPDLNEAILWYRKAADAGVDIAQHNLGRIYEDGGPGIEINLKEADKWYGKYLQARFP
jgi:hypothetical protein